ncbi:DUF4375 domain-containing protein [Acinetobacter chinensis]|uniref:DUF4375 domain-containing protein n=1 Tax=Acinetobacter chinensis TaxID=2004650 RepID=A0A3B7LRU6_9GAMM|nr:DUF4375 domain-containing protein [Acinetobacter chinensis]AXY55436.1 DUF4375 domain-containing protein [Acinetobacter chinensis]
MEGKVACSECNALILIDTATKNKGLCVPCAKGYRKQIEESKKRYQDDKKYRDSEEYRYWVNLLQKVSCVADLRNLAFEEQVYFVINVLIGEVFNGGFDQYFHNSSGNYYAETLQALNELKAFKSLELLESAKVILFGSLDVPSDRGLRFDILNSKGDVENIELDQLDRSFWEFPDQLDQKILQFAQLKKLFKLFE